MWPFWWLHYFGWLHRGLRGNWWWYCLQVDRGVQTNLRLTMTLRLCNSCAIGGVLAQIWQCQKEAGRLHVLQYCIIWWQAVHVHMIQMCNTACGGVRICCISICNALQKLETYMEWRICCCNGKNMSLRVLHWHWWNNLIMEWAECVSDDFAFAMKWQIFKMCVKYLRCVSNI